MFGRNKGTNPNEQIPYPLYETLRENTPSRWRGLVQVLVAAGIAALLAVGTAWLYRTLHDANTSGSVPRTDVTQSPQTNKSNNSSSKPDSTDAGQSTNAQNVTPPSGN